MSAVRTRADPPDLLCFSTRSIYSSTQIHSWLLSYTTRSRRWYRSTHVHDVYQTHILLRVSCARESCQGFLYDLLHYTSASTMCSRDIHTYDHHWSCQSVAAVSCDHHKYSYAYHRTWVYCIIKLWSSSVGIRRWPYTAVHTENSRHSAHPLTISPSRIITLCSLHPKSWIRSKRPPWRREPPKPLVYTYSSFTNPIHQQQTPRRMKCAHVISLFGGVAETAPRSAARVKRFCEFHSAFDRGKN